MTVLVELQNGTKHTYKNVNRIVERSGNVEIRGGASLADEFLMVYEKTEIKNWVILQRCPIPLSKGSLNNRAQATSVCYFLSSCLRFLVKKIFSASFPAAASVNFMTKISASKRSKEIKSPIGHYLSSGMCR
jgi:hypothetical protein